jgi:hypothetical protein
LIPKTLKIYGDGWISFRDQGIDSMAIPHNSNGSNGQMFSLTDFSGKDFTQEYSDIRMRNEPLVEISQIKGDIRDSP